jgi:hypothetical protein
MKKLIGVAIIMLTLILTVIYRQLTSKPVTGKVAKETITALLFYTI